MKIVRFSQNGTAPRPRGFLEGGVATQEVLAAMIDATKAGKLQPVAHPAGAVRLHAPIADPGKFICIGLNYKDHAAETGNPTPKEPPIFPKWANAILDPGEPILRPRGEKRLDWEVELGVVIGRTARHVSKEQALDYVYGYTIVNDATAPGFASVPAPVGPDIADRAEHPGPPRGDRRVAVRRGRVVREGALHSSHVERDIVSYLS